MNATRLNTRLSASRPRTASSGGAFFFTAQLNETKSTHRVLNNFFHNCSDSRLLCPATLAPLSFSTRQAFETEDLSYVLNRTFHRRFHDATARRRRAWMFALNPPEETER